MSKSDTFNLRDWLVPPVLLPIFFVLLIAVAVLVIPSLVSPPPPAVHQLPGGKRRDPSA
jgi:hypothetical protein